MQEPNVNPLVNISELKVRLEFDEFNPTNALALLSELRELGCDARPLVPDLVLRLRKNTFPYTGSSLVDVYVPTGDLDLREFIQTQDKSKLSLADQVKLFIAGVPDLEPGLLSYLRKHFKESDNHQRRLIVGGLASAGSVISLAVLASINTELSNSVSERRMGVSGTEDGGTLPHSAELRSDSSFLETVRDAFQMIEARTA